jgi:flagellar assembly factor FliW
MSTAVVINTSRFGEIEVEPRQLLHFPDGLIGLGGADFVRIPTEGPFTWLQSVSDPALALPLTDPRRFFADFTLVPAEADAERLGPDDQMRAVYVTVTAAPDPARTTANLKAPIVVLDGEPEIAHQVINQAPGAELRTPLFGAGATAFGRV